MDELPGAPTSSDTAPIVDLTDGRVLQAGAPSDADFFREHGFALLSHETAVTDWDATDRTPANEATRLYQSELEVIIRQRLLPGRPIEMDWGSLQRRGRGTSTPFYAEGAHSDFGLTADDYQENMEAYTTPEFARYWRGRYERPEVTGYVTLNFWRVTNMREPLRHMPLAVCDPRSIDPDDLVPYGLVDFAPTGKPTNQMGLKYDPAQAWWVYPGMVGGEVLVFTNFGCVKGEAPPRLRNCFHVAFVDPAAPADAQPRQSCEFRLGLFLLDA